jgi:ketosteroid isomerase-like protein
MPVKIFFASLLILCAALVGIAQTSHPNQDLNSMIETERAFSRMSEEQGTRESFTEFIAEDGILFRPGPVAGKKWMKENPLPASDKRPLLTWQPNFAGMSRAGDMGYTSGPWQYKSDIKDPKPAAFGDFMTVWKKQPDGRWRFAIDLGVSHPEPKSGAANWRPTVLPRSARYRRVDVTAAREGLLRTEREFSEASFEQGAVGAFLLYAANDVRVFRNDKMPLVGRKASVAAMAPLTREWTWKPTSADVSISGDVGYSYGVYELREKTGNRPLIESGNYLRIWRKVKGTWAMVIDVADPVPIEKKTN